MIRELGPVAEARVLEVARAADRDGRGVALLAGDGWDGLTLGIDPAEEHRVPFSPDAFTRCEVLLDQLATPRSIRGWNGGRPAARFIGYVAYEAARALERPAWSREEARPEPIGAALVLRRYEAVLRRDRRSGIAWIEGDDARAVERLSELVASAPARAPADVRLALEAVDDDATHAARIDEILERIARGEIYQACVARTFAARTHDRATDLLDAMLARTTARFASALDLGDHVVVSSSPELFLDVRGDVHERRVLTSPIKGTRPRGRDADDDRARIADLASDPKEDAELVMVVDLERNDLGRVSQIGTVRVLGPARIETSRTVHHRVRDVVSTLRPDIGLGALFRATFPSGSVTGAPKVRAMEIIAELERDRRGVYCGAILAIDRAGGARAAMAIRTLVADNDGRATYIAGGGIVHGSDTAREVAETHWKAAHVMPS
jgi:anthranilate/para-aminobenzoate synthase component I